MIFTVMKIFVVVLVVSLVFVFSPVVEARDFSAIYKECGLGGILLPDNAVGAVFINIMTSWGSTAISSDVSSPESCAGGKASTAALIYEGYDSLEKDLARGNGDYLNALMTFSGRNISESQPFILALRKGFSVSVAVEGYSEQTRFQKAENLYNLFYSLVDGEFPAPRNSNKS